MTATTKTIPVTPLTDQHDPFSATIPEAFGFNSHYWDFAQGGNQGALETWSLEKWETLMRENGRCGLRPLLFLAYGHPQYDASSGPSETCKVYSVLTPEGIADPACATIRDDLHDQSTIPSAAIAGPNAPGGPPHPSASPSFDQHIRHKITEFRINKVNNAMKSNRSPASLYLSVMVVILLAGCSTGKRYKETPTMNADLRISVTHDVLHPVNKRLFGQFLEKPSWGGETGPEAALLPGTRQLDPRVEEKMQAMEIPIVRFPGGTDVDYLDWRDMVTDAHGTGAGRPNSISRRHKGGEQTITNAFGYDEYFQLAGRLGWESILVVNLRDGLLTEKSPEEAAAHAAALLAYCAGDSSIVPGAFRQWPELRAANGHPAPYPVEYVQIGNEAWWSEQMREKHGDAWIQAWSDTIELYIAALRKIAPDVNIIVDAYPLEISAELVRRGARVDLYALHRYYPLTIKALFDANGDPLPPEQASPKQIWDTLVHSAETDASGLGQRQDKAIDQARELGFKLAMTEWNLNGWWSIKERRDLWPGPSGLGMGAAYMLQSMLRNGDVIELATQSMLVGKSWGIAGIRVAEDGVAPPVFAPSVEATTLYRKHHGNRRLAVHYETKTEPWTPEVLFNKEYRVTERALTLDVVGTRDDWNLYLHILNTDYDQPHRIRVRFDDLPVVEGRATLHRLRFMTRDEQQKPGAWTLSETETIAVTPEGLSVVSPSRSATVVVIPLQKELGTISQD